MELPEGYVKLDRIDILCGHKTPEPFPCEICKKIECRGESKKCKGYGAWSYCLKL